MQRQGTKMLLGFEPAIDEYLREEAAEDESVCAALKGWFGFWSVDENTIAAVTDYYQAHCAECDGLLTDEDWQLGDCKHCGVCLLPF